MMKTEQTCFERDGQLDNGHAIAESKSVLFCRNKQSSFNIFLKSLKSLFVFFVLFHVRHHKM